MPFMELNIVFTSAFQVMLSWTVQVQGPM